MKATELMIGDWVFLKNGKVLQTCKVTVIGNATQNRNKIGKYVCLDASDEFPTCIFEIDKISPIPLTPEILEKNGFSEDYCYEDLSYAHNCGDIIGIHINGKNGLMDEMYFKYVHQLQQALRLCGIEKEIEL